MMPLFDDTDLVFSYSRRQALEDGVLVDVSEMAREAGFRYPVAVTRAVWDGVVTPDAESRALGQSEAGRLWDVLTVLRVAIRRSKGPAQTLEFQVIVIQHGADRRIVTLKAVCGPADDWSPCVTVMLPAED